MSIGVKGLCRKMSRYSSGCPAPSQDVRERAGYILAISVGLGSLFDDSERAELAWLKAPRDALNGNSSLAYMLEGRMANLMHVATMVARERGM